MLVSLQEIRTQAIQRQRDNYERTQEEYGHFQAKEENQICQHLDLRLLASKTMRKYIYVVYAISLW